MDSTALLEFLRDGLVQTQCGFATSVPPPRFHTVKYSGILAPASPWRSRIAPPKDATLEAIAANENATRGYRPWAELLKRTFAVGVLACPKCTGRMTLLAFVTEPESIQRLLTALGESSDVPERAPSRGPPHWKSTVLRRRALGHAA